MSLATFQRTAETRRAAPTPTMAPVMVWVVDTGTPRKVAANSVAAPPVSAQNPCIGVSLVIRKPMVRTMRQPPIRVPSAIAAWHDSTTQNGTEKCFAEMALRVEQHRDDAHGLLRVVAAVTQRIQRRRDELQDAECAVHGK